MIYTITERSGAHIWRQEARKRRDAAALLVERMTYAAVAGSAGLDTHRGRMAHETALEVAEKIETVAAPGVSYQIVIHAPSDHAIYIEVSQ